MKQALALFLCLLVPTLAFASNGYKVMYDGGSLLTSRPAPSWN